MIPEFSSTIFFCPEKNGCVVGSTSRSTGSLPRLSTIAPASSGTTAWYIVGCSPLNLDQRPGSAQPHAAHAFDLALVLEAVRLHLRLERRLHLVAARGETTGGHAHSHRVLQGCYRFLLRFGNLFQFFEIQCDLHPPLRSQPEGDVLRSISNF